MGFSGSMRLSEQIRILEKLLQMVICLKGEIRCGNASLPDAFYGAAGRMNGKYREFLISAADRMKAGTGEKLSQICRECAESALKKSCLTHGEKDAFFSFGEYLGYMDLEMQMYDIEFFYIMPNYCVWPSKSFHWDFLTRYRVYFCFLTNHIIFHLSYPPLFFSHFFNKNLLLQSFQAVLSHILEDYVYHPPSFLCFF